MKKKNDTLVKAPASIDQEINWLKAREQKLLMDLTDVRSIISQEEDRLVHLSKTIKKMREDLAIKIHNIKALHQSIKPILGSVDADQHEIDEVDQIRSCAVYVIEKAL